MKCKICKKEIESKEIKGTSGMRTGYCCDEVQVDPDSLRQKVKEGILKTNLIYIFCDNV